MPKRKRAAAKAQATTYEELLQQLETTVQELEGGGISLEEAMSAYEQGVSLAAQCQKLLDTAEQRIQELQEAEES